MLVLNGNGTTGAAAVEAERVRAKGYRIASVGDAPTPRLPAQRRHVSQGLRRRRAAAREGARHRRGRAARRHRRRGSRARTARVWRYRRGSSAAVASGGQSPGHVTGGSQAPAFTASRAMSSGPPGVHRRPFGSSVYASLRCPYASIRRRATTRSGRAGPTTPGCSAAGARRRRYASRAPASSPRRLGDARAGDQRLEREGIDLRREPRRRRGPARSRRARARATTRTPHARRAAARRAPRRDHRDRHDRDRPQRPPDEHERLPRRTEHAQYEERRRRHGQEVEVVVGQAVQQPRGRKHARRHSRGRSLAAQPAEPATRPPTPTPTAARTRRSRRARRPRAPAGARCAAASPRRPSRGSACAQPRTSRRPHPRADRRGNVPRLVPPLPRLFDERLESRVGSFAEPCRSRTDRPAHVTGLPDGQHERDETDDDQPQRYRAGGARPSRAAAARVRAPQTTMPATTAAARERDTEHGAVAHAIRVRLAVLDERRPRERPADDRRRGQRSRQPEQRPPLAGRRAAARARPPRPRRAPPFATPRVTTSTAA